MRECNSFSIQTVEIWCENDRVAECMNRVIALLIQRMFGCSEVIVGFPMAVRNKYQREFDRLLHKLSLSWLLVY